MLRDTERNHEKGTLFVTGGASGIGKAVIDRVSDRYVQVENFDVQHHRLQDVRNPRALHMTMNESLKPGVQNDLVVAAGVFRPVPFTEQTQADIDFVIGTNLIGALHTTQGFLRWHQERPETPRPNIVVVSSISAFYPGGETNVVYDATKAALSNTVTNLANYAVTNAVEPGTVRGTAIGGWNADFSHDANARKIVEQGQAADAAAGNEVLLEDVAKTIEWLLFDNQAGAINGTTITVDGGQTVKRRRF